MSPHGVGLILASFTDFLHIFLDFGTERAPEIGVRAGSAGDFTNLFAGEGQL